MSNQKTSYRKGVHRLWPLDADSTLSGLLEVNRRNAERWRQEGKTVPASVEAWVAKANAALDDIGSEDPHAGAIMGRMIQALWGCSKEQAELAPRILQAILENDLHHGPEEWGK